MDLKMETLPIADRSACFEIANAEQVATILEVLYCSTTHFMHLTDEQWKPYAAPDWALGMTLFVAATEESHAAAKLEVRDPKDVFNAH